MIPPVSRRQLVLMSCAAGLTALAGCLGGGDDDSNTASGTNGANKNSSDGENGGGDDDSNGANGNSSDGENGGGDGDSNGANGTDGSLPALRPYPEYVATDQEGEALAIYANLASLGAANSGFNDLISNSEDPLLLIPAEGTSILLNSSVTLESLGLGALLDRGETGLQSRVGGLLLASGAFVALGDIATEEIAQTLESDSGGAFEQQRETGSHTLYQQAGEGGVVVAVSEAAVVVANDQATVERAVEAAEGNRERAGTTVEGFGQVLDAVDDPDVAFAGHGSATEQPDEGDPTAALSGASSFMTAHTFDGDELTAEAAAVFPSAAALDDAREQLEATLGSEAGNSSIEFDTDLVTATATYQAGTTDGDG